MRWKLAPVGRLLDPSLPLTWSQSCLGRHVVREISLETPLKFTNMFH
jgi:hypothetical protein